MDRTALGKTQLRRVAVASRGKRLELTIHAWAPLEEHAAGPRNRHHEERARQTEIHEVEAPGADPWGEKSMQPIQIGKFGATYRDVHVAPRPRASHRGGAEQHDEFEIWSRVVKIVETSGHAFDLSVDVVSRDAHQRRGIP